MRIRAIAFLILSLHTLTASALSEQDLQVQLDLLMSWWPGNYDNNEQIVRQSGGGLSAQVYEPHFRLHAIYRRVELPSLGDHVLYVEEYKNNDPENLYRIRLYSLGIDTDAGAIRIKLHAFPDQTSWIGAHEDAERLSQIDVSQLRAFSDACDVLLHYEGGQFTGGMQARACRIASGQGSAEKDAYFDYDVVVGEDYYWFRDRTLRLADDTLVWQLAPGSEDYFLLDKATWFSCVVNYNLDGDMTATEELTTVRLHDQGGEAAIDYPVGRALALVMHNRAFSVPAERRYRILRLHEDGHHVPLAYSYAADAADRFGLNLGWFYTLCRQEEDGV